MLVNKQNQTSEDIATDQLLNAVYLAMRQVPEARQEFLKRLSTSLKESKGIFEPLR